MQESAGYPSASTRLSKDVTKKLLDLPSKSAEKMTVSWFKENVWNSTQDFHIPADQVICGMQANIFKIHLKDGLGNVKSVIGKRVVPNELPAKANLDLWQDFLQSVERETLFYKNKSRMNPSLFPEVYYSNGYTDQADIMQSYYLIIMEDVSNDYFQDTGMNQTQAGDLMKALAKFHATHWRKISENTRGSFWVLSRRQPLGEIENADQTWKALLERFPQFKQLFHGVEDLGIL